MAKPVIVAIDAGTTKIKAGLVDIDGRLIDLVSVDNDVISPFAGAFEMDMDKVWDKVCAATKELTGRNQDSEKDIAGLGITGQGDGLWPIDDSGKPIRNAILWNDTRTKHMKLEMEGKIHELAVHQRVTPVFPGAASVLLKWLIEKEPESARKVSYILHCKDWLNFNFTGKIVTDYTDASTALLNIFEKHYSEDIFDVMGISEYIYRFPTPVPSFKAIGTVSENAGMKSGVSPGTPVIAGALDGAAAAFGAGIKEVGQAFTIAGTTLNNMIILDKGMVDHKDTRGSNLCHILPDIYIRVMANQSGTSALDWVSGILCRGLGFNHIEKAVMDIPIGSDGVTFHPYLYGERAPFKNPWACGGFFGLTARHNEYHMIRAAYEGLAFSLFDCYMAFPPVFNEIFLSGGGSKSNFLCQIFPDCLGKTIKRSCAKELGIIGMAEATLIGLGISDGFKRPNAPCDHFEPNMERHEIYMRHYEVFSELRSSMEGYWNSRKSYQELGPGIKG